MSTIRQLNFKIQSLKGQLKFAIPKVKNTINEKIKELEIKLKVKEEEENVEKD